MLARVTPSLVITSTVKGRNILSISLKVSSITNIFLVIEARRGNSLLLLSNQKSKSSVGKYSDGIVSYNLISEYKSPISELRRLLSPISSLLISNLLIQLKTSYNFFSLSAFFKVVLSISALFVILEFSLCILLGIVHIPFIA